GIWIAPVHPKGGDGFPITGDELFWFSAEVFASFIVSWPLYLIAVAVTLVFARSIAAYPGFWSAAAVWITACYSYSISPFDNLLNSLGTVGTLGAALAGLCFYLCKRLLTAALF
ncbi:MAG: hypothetical protein ACT4N2_10875, partial [Hyphomicrobium sp.]